MLKKIAILLFVALVLGGPAHSASWKDLLPEAKLVGQSKFRWLFFDIYTAKLWSERMPFDPKASFALELTYHRPITSEDIVRSSIDEIKRIFGSTYSAVQLKGWEKELARIFPDVLAGDQLVGVYLPQRGCIFFQKSKRLAEIDDLELAQAFFAIWLDDRTRDQSMRADLLGALK